jgi:predicted amino acid racemase
MTANAYQPDSGPVIEVDIAAVEKNARTIAGLCGDHGISVTAVTKVTCGMPQVARALTASGISQLGESRLENVHRLRAGGISAPVMLLRIPPLSAAEEIVRTVDVSLNSELPVISRLSEVAQSLGIVHDIILMVDLGDLREGIWPEDLMSTVARVRELEGVRIAGIGTNLTCYGGVIPTEKNLGRLVDYAKRIEDRFGFRIETISGGIRPALSCWPPERCRKKSTTCVSERRSSWDVRRCIAGPGRAPARRPLSSAPNSSKKRPSLPDPSAKPARTPSAQRRYSRIGETVCGEY